MIEHLEIRNYALIENLSIDFSDGFNVITGETGAGKSIILGALGLLMGEKADSTAIRNGADEIVVNAIVSIPESHESYSFMNEHGIVPEDNRVIIKRVVKANGRSVISVQGQLLTRQELTEFADSIIDMHGQSEHQSLLLPDKQRRILDYYAQNSDLLSECTELYKKIGLLEKQKEELFFQIEEGNKQSDYLQFALEEINNANINDVEEDEKLKEKLNVISQYESIYENINGCIERLKGTKSAFYDSLNLCAKASKSDSSLTEYTARLESLRIEAEDISSSLSDYVNSLEFSEDSINQMQERLAILQKVKRKYGNNLSEVMKFAEEAEEKINLSRNSEIGLDRINKEIEQVHSDYIAVSEELSLKRKKYADNLQNQIETVLRTLGMPNAEFRINLVKKEKIGPSGMDEVVFMISANPGEKMKELREIASGGELSRVMLALKAVMAHADSIETQVFDEVDSGIGGSVALSLAACISNLSKEKQVIAITHLASIASKADSQFVVSKNVENGRTFSHLTEVSGEERVHEIARMLSGDEQDITLEHARGLLNSSDK